MGEGLRTRALYVLDRFSVTELYPGPFPNVFNPCLVDSKGAELINTEASYIPRRYLQTMWEESSIVYSHRNGVWGSSHQTVQRDLGVAWTRL